MGRVRLVHGGATSDVLLPASALVGRHWSCAGVLPVAQVPLYWLEIRWHGDSWAWRELTPRGQTRGAGDLREDGWRTLTRGARLRWSEHVHVELLEDAAPGPALVSLQGLPPRFGDALVELLELSPEGARPLGEESVPPRWLQDGEVVTLSAPGEPARAWRWLAGEAPVLTARDGFNVTHPEVVLDVDLSALTASFTLRTRAAQVRGECARMLAVYALARLDEDWLDGGFLTAAEAVARWEELGGARNGPPERAAWERGRLRTQLASQGVRGLDGLFERGRRDGEPTFRLGLHPSRVHGDVATG